MIDALKPYPEYTDTGEPWLGAAPSHWRMRRAKYVLREIDNRWTERTGTLLSVSQYTGITKRRLREGSDEPATRSATLEGYKVIAVDDLAVNIMLAWNGSLGVSPFDGVVSPAYCVYRFRSGAPQFFHHLLRSPDYRSEIKRRSRGVVESRLRLYSDDLFRMPLLVPPPAEQAGIVRFLGAVDRKVNRFIRAKRRLIEVLTEQKQAIITQAVTKGLNPSAPLKPSGIDWLGEMPAHWQELPLKRLVYIDNSGSYGEDPELGEVVLPVATTAQINRDGRFDVNRMPRRGFSARDADRYSCRAGEILVVKSSGSIFNVISGKAGLVFPDTPPFVFSNFLLRLRPARGQVDSHYLFYFLICNVTRNRVYRMVAGTTYPNLRVDDYSSALIPVPPVSEQTAIVREVQLRLAGVESVIARVLREIDLIREYRTRLVADVVTGKVDVRAMQLHDDAGSDACPDAAASPDSDDEQLEADEEHAAPATVEAET